MPDQISRVVKLWKAKLSSINEKAGQSLADPEEYENLFPGYKEACAAQKFMENECKLPPARTAATAVSNRERKPIEEMRAAISAGTFSVDALLFG